MIEKKEYSKVKIEGLFNLEEFSAEYQLSPDEVIRFHNSHCSISELLTMSLPKHVDFVYLPAKNYDERQRKLLKNTNLNLPINSSEKTYGVLLKFHPKELQIHYKVRIKRSCHFIELQKEKTYVNDKEIDQTVEQMFEKVAQVLYPLQISLDKNGKINQILNHEDIAVRWKNEFRPKLKEYYQSKSTDDLLQKLDEAFCNIQEKRALFERNVFYKLFFLPVYQSYPSFLKEDVLHVYFSGIGQEVTYRINYELEKEFTATDKIVLWVYGLEEESFFNKNREKGTVDLCYKFDKDTQEIFSITGLLSVFEKGEKFYLDFQLYEVEKS